MTVSPLVWEEVTFSTCAVLRTTSLIWLSHIPHIIPFTFSVVCTIGPYLLLLDRAHRAFFIFIIPHWYANCKCLRTDRRSQYTGVVYFSRIYVFPIKYAVLQRHVAVGTVFLRDAQ